MKYSRNSYNRLFTILFTYLIVGILSPATLAQPIQQVMYVDASVSASGDGSSWAQAYKHMDEALMAATYGSSLWVKAGSYDLRDLDDTYTIASGISIYGGFVGDEVHPAARTEFLWEEKNETRLIGDLVFTPDSANYNSFDGISLYTDQPVDYSTILSFFTIMPKSAVPERFYVDGSKGVNGDGLSWSTAFNNLNSALVVAGPGDDIWIKSGTYKINDDKDNNELGVTFQIPSGLKISGGFAGTEVDEDERDMVDGLYTNKTTISTYNSSQPLVQVQTVFNVVADSYTTIFDGLEITGEIYPYTDKESTAVVGDNIWLKNCKLRRNGAISGGAFKGNNSRITECVFELNRAADAGSIAGDNLIIENSSFINNEADTNTDLSITNSQINGTSFNSSNAPSFAIQSLSSLVVSNSTFDYGDGLLKFDQCSVNDSELLNNEEGNLEITNSVFDKCKFNTYDGSGVIRLSTLVGTGGIIKNSEFSGNNSVDLEFDAELSQCVFFENIGGVDLRDNSKVTGLEFVDGSNSVLSNDNSNSVNCKFSGNSSVDIDCRGNASMSDIKVYYNSSVNVDVSGSSTFENIFIANNDELDIRTNYTNATAKIDHVTIFATNDQQDTDTDVLFGANVEVSNSLFHLTNLTVNSGVVVTHNAAFSDIGPNTLVLNPDNLHDDGAQIAFDTLLLATSPCIGAGSDGSNMGAYLDAGDGLSRVFFPVKDGNWEDGETWNYGVAPPDGYDVVISGQKVSLNSEILCRSVQIKQADNTNVGELLINSGGHLKVIEYLDVEEQTTSAAELNQLYVMPGGQVEILEEE